VNRHVAGIKELFDLTLYRYRDLSSDEKLNQTCDSIKNNYIFWPSPKDFNDPFDSRPAFINEGSAEDRWRRSKQAARVLQAGQPRSERLRIARKSLSVRPDDVLMAMRQAREQELEHYGVVCLTTVRDNILMWSHYAGSHTGICLGYGPTQEAIDFACSYKVRYESVRPQFNLMKSMVDQEIFDALITKSKDWEYEKEWRMIDHKIGERKKVYPPKALVEIVFGCSVSKENITTVLDAVKASQSSPNILITSPSETHFSLDINEYQQPRY
jgi:Protein of unknown function (DUF2971)